MKSWPPRARCALQHRDAVLLGCAGIDGRFIDDDAAWACSARPTVSEAASSGGQIGPGAASIGVGTATMKKSAAARSAGSLVSVEIGFGEIGRVDFAACGRARRATRAMRSPARGRSRSPMLRCARRRPLPAARHSRARSPRSCVRAPPVSAPLTRGRALAPALRAGKQTGHRISFERFAYHEVFQGVSND